MDRWTLDQIEITKRASRKAFDPDEARDDHGMWTASGEGTSLGPADHFITRDELDAERQKALDKFAAAPRPTAADIAHAHERIAAVGAAQYHNEEKGNTTARAARREELLTEFGDGKTCGCIYCGVRLDGVNGKLTGVGMTQDHLYPSDAGGTFKVENLVPACMGCNRERGDTPFGDISWQ